MSTNGSWSPTTAGPPPCSSGPDDLESPEETLAVLAPETLRGIREGQDAIRRGDVIEGADTIAALRPTR